MAYIIQFLPTALRELEELPAKIKAQVGRRIAALADDPRPATAKMLQGRHGYYRIRSGDYRVIYMIEDDVLVVLVVKVGHRREVYRK
jgi:mRNA interferase RelE/StbE